MDTPSPSPTEYVRPTDRVLAVLAARSPMRTEEVAAQLPDLPNSTVRLALSRLGKRGKITSPAYGVWATLGTPRAARPPVPRAELVIPGSTSEDLLMWASNTEENNPVTRGLEPFRPAVDLTITDRPFMGVELTFTAGGRPIFTLALFSDLPTEEERAIMAEESVGSAGL